MASNERIRKYLDAGTVLGQVSRGRAEEIVRELVNAGDIQRSQAQEWVDSLLERSRRTTEQVLEAVRHEVAAQLSRIDGKALESLANQVADVLKRSADTGRKTTRGVTTEAGKRASAARTQAGRTASAARTQAAKTATRAGSTASAARTQVAKTATQARAAAGKAVPARRPSGKGAAAKPHAKAAPATRAPAKKTDSAKKATKKAAS